jgi:hypothetical protein
MALNLHFCPICCSLGELRGAIRELHAEVGATWPDLAEFMFELAPQGRECSGCVILETQR